MVNKIRVREEGEPRLAGKSSQQVENKVKGDVKLAKATKSKQPRATQAKKPPEDRILSAKELAQIANTTPTNLRECLRSNFASKIPRGDDGKQYRLKASDPLVQEIIAKVKAKGNGSNPAEATTVITPEPPKAEAKKQERVKAKQAEANARFEAQAGNSQTPERRLPLCNATCCFWQSDGTCSKSNQKAEEGLTCELFEPRASKRAKPAEAESPTQQETDKGEGEEPSPESSSQENESYSGWDNFSPKPDFNTNSSIALTQSNKPEVVGSNPTPATREN